MRRSKILFILLVTLASILCWLISANWHRIGIEVGTPVDSLNGVYVYHNGSTRNVEGRNVRNGYNLGQKYQCVEFVKRYYYEHYNHKMSNEYGNAIDFFQKKLSHGNLNKDRGLIQFHNGGDVKPQVGDIIIFDATLFNRCGHVAIVSQVTADKVEIIQQNYGYILWSRRTLSLINQDKKWRVNSGRVLGWLRKR